MEHDVLIPSFPCDSSLGFVMGGAEVRERDAREGIMEAQVGRNLCVRLFSHNVVKKCLDLWVLGYPSCMLVSLWAFSHYFQCLFVSLSFIFLPIWHYCVAHKWQITRQQLESKWQPVLGSMLATFFPFFSKEFCLIKDNRPCLKGMILTGQDKLRLRLVMMNALDWSFKWCCTAICLPTACCVCCFNFFVCECIVASCLCNMYWFININPLGEMWRL